MNVFDLVATLTLDNTNYKKILQESGQEGQNAVKTFDNMSNSIKKGFVFAGKLAGTTLLASAAAAGGLAKKATDAYAQYEQLVGGVDTLFGESSKKVQKYADGAYKTAGLSANKYMETVTSFSASLLQGLGGDTKKAADIADVAITDMADNANKMGTSMEMIQNAYQGFAKSNYTMLDNLKLGKTCRIA